MKTDILISLYPQILQKRQEDRPYRIRDGISYLIAYIAWLSVTFAPISLALTVSLAKPGLIVFVVSLVSSIGATIAIPYILNWLWRFNDILRTKLLKVKSKESLQIVSQLLKERNSTTSQNESPSQENPKSSSPVMLKESI